MPVFNESKWIDVELEDLNHGSVDVDVDIDISASDFLDECSNEDIIELVDELEDRGYLKNIERTNPKFNSLDDDEWNKIILKLSNPFARLILSNEDTELIKQISDKL
jgi:hypothetical protein